MEITLSKSLLIAVVLAPLFGSIIAGLFGRQVKRFGADHHHPRRRGGLRPVDVRSTS